MNNNKTFADLKKGDKIYVVVTDLSKLTIGTLIVDYTEERHSGSCIIFHVTRRDGLSSRGIVYLEDYNKDTSNINRFIVWHTNENAARQTIKEILKYRIKRKQETIRDAKRAIENYKRELKEYEDY